MGGREWWVEGNGGWKGMVGGGMMGGREWWVEGMVGGREWWVEGNGGWEEWGGEIGSEGMVGGRTKDMGRCPKNVHLD